MRWVARCGENTDGRRRGRASGHNVLVLFCTKCHHASPMRSSLISSRLTPACWPVCRFRGSSFRGVPRGSCPPTELPPGFQDLGLRVPHVDKKREGKLSRCKRFELTIGSLQKD